VARLVAVSLKSRRSRFAFLPALLPFGVAPCRSLPEGKVELLAVGRVKPYWGNSRTHSCKQIKQIAQSIQRFGFTNPVLPQRKAVPEIALQTGEQPITPRRFPPPCSVDELAECFIVRDANG